MVKLVSNIHGVDPIDQVERYSQAEKKRVKVDRPLLIAKYNQGMGGVDVFDGHVASYRISIRGKKWWWPHLIKTIDCLMWSFIKVSQCNPASIYSLDHVLVLIKS